MMGKNICGIDPGASGAIAFYDVEELIIYDMPVYEIKRGKMNRKHIDFRELCKIISTQNPTHAFIERVSARFGESVSASFSFGWSCGALEHAMIACNIPFTYITPQSWKKTMGCPADKDASRQRASQLLPQFAHNWSRKKDDGRAESALIALYGFNK